MLGLRGIAIVSLYATVPALAASAAYFTSDSSIDKTATRTVFSSVQMKITVTLFLVLQSISILLIATTAVRPISYYLLVALSGLVILVQILWLELSIARIRLFLLEISVLILNIIWSVTLNYYYFFGRTDVFPHHLSVEILLETHYVTATFGEYEAFPLWHIFVGFQTLLFDRAIDPLTLFFVTTGILFAVAIPSIYALSRRFSLSREISLIAALSMCLHPWVILYGMYSIPRSVTSILFALCLLLLARNEARSSILFVFLLIAIAIYHTVSLPFIFVTVGVYFVIERFLVLESRPASYVVSSWELGSIPIVQLLYWAIAEPRLIGRILETATVTGSIGGGSEGGNLTDELIAMPYHELVNYLPFGILLLFVLFAVLHGHRVMQLSNRAKSLLLTALLLTVVSFPGPALLISFVTGLTADNIIRFGQYTYPLITISVGVGIIVVNRARFRFGSQNAKMAVLLFLFVSSGFLAVSNDFTASDNPAVEREFYNFYLSESEVEGFDTIAARSQSEVMGDYVTCRYLDNPGREECNIIQADPVAEELHYLPGNVLVLRKGELEERPLSLYPTSEPVDEPPYSNHRDYFSKESGVWDDLSTKHKVYDSDDVSAYANSSISAR